MTRRTLGFADGQREVKACPECDQRFGADAMFCPFDGAKLDAAAWDPSGDPLVGTVVEERYDIVDVLGEGGMGKVYEVRHRLLGRSFAMKVLRRDLARDDVLATRFIQEARATAAIRHPNIVSITDFGRLADGTPYYVMELLSGRTLADVIRVGGPVPAGRAVRIVRQIADALGAAHAAGIVHRDMKPDNVFLVGGVHGGTASDDVRIVDFGAAKILGASRLTKTGIVFGTPHYMSPEQASGQQIDHRADVYALGIIMYEMFTGRVPFEADTYMGVLTQHMFVQPVPPSRVVGAVPELGALEAITLRALEKRPEDRYGSMAELIRDLDRIARVASDGRVEIAPQLEGAPPRRSNRPVRMADELEPPTLAEMRHVIESLSPPARAPSWRWVALASALVGLLGGGTYFALRPEARTDQANPPGGEPVGAAPAPSMAAGTPTIQNVVVRTSPPGAQIFRGDTRLGEAPVLVDPTAGDPGAVYVARSPGYADQTFVLNAQEGEVYVELRRVSASAPPKASNPVGVGGAAPPKRAAEGSMDDIDDPFVRR